jgi:capsular exopolysaccharide synthesis family protein
MSEIAMNVHNDELRFDLYDIIRDLLKDWWLILVFGLTVALCSYITADVIYTPAYVARATFAVTSKGANNTYDNLAAANTVASSLTNIFEGELIKKRVAMDIGAEDIPDYISAELIPETNLFVLKVSAPSPQTAYRIILSIMDNYTSVTNSLYQNAIIDVLEAPEIPMYPDNPLNMGRIMKLAFLGGAAAMILLLAILSVTRDNIKNVKEVTRKLDTKLFGVIYHENRYKTLRAKLHRKKKSILITSPTVSFSFVESIKSMRSKFEYKASAKNQKVLLVTSLLENEGKSTVATNLALALAQKSKKVLLIDADFCKPSIHKILEKEVPEAQELGEYLLKKRDLKDVLMVDENSGIFLLIGSKYYSNSTDLITGTAFSEMIEIQKNIMDYVIIDSPPISVSADTELLADIADSTLLVVRQSYAKAKYINDVIDTLSETNSELLGCVYNNVRIGPLGYRPGYHSKYSYQSYYGYHNTEAAYQSE